MLKNSLKTLLVNQRTTRIKVHEQQKNCQKVVSSVSKSCFQSQFALTRLELHAKSGHAIQHRCGIDVFGEEICKHLLSGFLAKCDSAFSAHCLHPEEHCVDVFHSSEPSSASNRSSICSVHPHMSFEFPSPVQENALQTKHLRSRTHQPIILCFTRAKSNPGLSLAVRGNGTAR